MRLLAKRVRCRLLVVIAIATLLMAVGACDKEADGPIKAKIVKPIGSKGDAVDATSWSGSAPYRFDFQWVKYGTPGYYTNTIQGQIVGQDAASCERFWSVSKGEFQNHDAGKPQEKTGTDSPTYRASETGDVTLTLDARDTDEQGNKKTVDSATKTMQVFEDHLARDYDNFGTGRSCKDNWTFHKHGVTIHMGHTWNCHGSARHHYDGSGTGSSSNVAFASTWPSSQHQYPFSTAALTALSQLSRGDIVSYYDEQNRLGHTHTSSGGGGSMYGANNRPLTPSGESWKWDTCDARAYADSIAAYWPQVFPGWELDHIIIRTKP